MKSFRASFLALVPLLFAACGSVAPVSSGTSGIVIGPGEIRECGQGKVQFPAGLYTATVVSAKGTYYLAPERIRTKGVLLGRAERGGIFVSSAPGNPQAAWFGDLSATVAEKAGTLFEAIGVKEPKLWPYTPRIPFQVKK
ncbi:MAG: hypothetical protein J0L73_17490 [Verrucomicrobia bacterium]|nr:hypothetical protein [Verrucomicrobiota bacterium]